MKRFALGLIVAASVLAGGSLVAVTGHSKPVPGLSAVDKLVAEDEIRQKLVLYGLYADGDGEQPKNIRALADKLLTPDAVSETFTTLGKPGFRTQGRDALVAATPPAEVNSPNAGRHYLIGTVFDEMTPTTAKTRSTAYYINATRNMVGADCKTAGPGACGGQVNRALMFVYHMDWVKNAQGWQIQHSVLRSDN